MRHLVSAVMILSPVKHAVDVGRGGADAFGFRIPVLQVAPHVKLDLLIKAHASIHTKEKKQKTGGGKKWKEANAAAGGDHAPGRADAKHKAAAAAAIPAAASGGGADSSHHPHLLPPVLTLVEAEVRPTRSLVAYAFAVLLRIR